MKFLILKTELLEAKIMIKNQITKQDNTFNYLGNTSYANMDLENKINNHSKTLFT
jgi:hypothetical protein